MDDLRTIANDMALVAQKNPHNYLERPIVPLCCARNIAYGSQIIEVVFSFDIYPLQPGITKTAWHLSVTPPECPLSEKEMQEWLLAFFGTGPVQEITQGVREAFAGCPMPEHQRQFIKLVE